MTTAAFQILRELGWRGPGGFDVGGYVHAPRYANRVPFVKWLVRDSWHELGSSHGYHSPMSKKQKPGKPNHHLRAWRIFNKMTLEELGEAVGTTKGVISELELSKKGLSHKWLVRLAPALKTRPGWILEYDPETLDHEALEAFMRLSPEKRAQAIKIIAVLDKKAG